MDIYDLMKQVNDAFNQRYCFSSKRKNSKRYGFTILDNSSLSVRRKRCKNVLIRLAVKARGSEVQKTMAKYTKRRDKRGYEWKSAYREKEALMLERGYPEVSPHDFYRELFPAGSLQQEPEDGKGNIIATQIRPSGKGRTRQWVIDDSLKMLDKVIGDRFGLIPPISFYGKSHTKENAHELFAVVVDVDYVGKQQLKNLLKQFGNGVQLRPTYLVSSGKGVHLYYFLQEPVQLYRNREEVLAELKEAFIRLMNERGYGVDWQDSHKYITYTDLAREQAGEKACKIRDNKLEKYYNMDFGKESMEHEFERNARTAEAEQSKRAASRVKPTEPDRAGKQSAQRSVGDVERELRGIDEAVKSRTSEGRAEQAERRRAEQEAHQRAEAERRAAEEQQRIASRRYIGRDWEPER
ncbi:hypothetical protein LZW70_00990 [Campylobacter coli]|nr:hypothetical protein [Campylobacter coli]